MLIIPEKKCEVCSKPFTPSKYRPNQTVCGQAACQRQRQIKNIKEWHRAHKESMGPAEKEAVKKKYREWRKKHQQYIKLYRESKLEEYRDYMRTYMQQYRKKKAGQKAAPPQESAT